MIWAESEPRCGGGSLRTRRPSGLTGCSAPMWRRASSATRERRASGGSPFLVPTPQKARVSVWGRPQCRGGCPHRSMPGDATPDTEDIDMTDLLFGAAATAPDNDDALELLAEE